MLAGVGVSEELSVSLWLGVDESSCVLLQSKMNQGFLRPEELTRQ